MAVIAFPQRTSDTSARERIRTSLGESLIVEASAGTGKTTELVNRLLRVLQTGTGRIENIAAVTFTHKAAGELKLRLRQRLDEARHGAADPAEIVNLEDALKRLEEAAIGTIHSFCAQILRERPVEAVVDPAFQELSEAESNRIYERAFRNWFARQLNEPSPGLRRALVRLAWRDRWDSTPPLERLKSAGQTLIEWRDFPTAWKRPEYDRISAIDLLVDTAFELGSQGKPVQALRDFLVRVQRAEATSPRDYDTLEGLFPKLRRELRKRKAYDRYCASIDIFTDAADAELAALLRDEMAGLVTEYNELKRRTGKLDFNDLLILVRDLLRNNAEVRGYLQERFTHIFVDEFQDTDPLQAEILVLLAADDPREASWLRSTPVPGKLFLVGDPKQSIYKFRRADLTLYRQVCDELSGRGVGLVRLTRSFRSVQPIQEFVNAAFEPEMRGDIESGQANYSPLEEGARRIDGQPSLIALPASKPERRNGRTTKDSVEECLPATIVAFVEWLINHSGWRVRDPGDSSKTVPVQSHHIGILFRRYMKYGVDLTREYARELEARDIRHLLVGSKSFHDREEVETLRAALSAVEWPDDELSVFATLKGSLFAVTDGLLLRYRHEVGGLDPFRAKPSTDSDFAPIEEALDLLARLHQIRNHRPIADTINTLLEATRSHAGFALRPAGHQVLANVYRVVTMARNFELTGGISFRAFVEELDAQAERTDSSEAPVLEEGAEGVRLMTVHNAKGLEFPVVILADLTCRISAEKPDRYIDAERRLCATRLLGCAPLELRDFAAIEAKREEAEGVRIAYVAATRARDLLVVPVIGDGEFDGWLKPLNKALYPTSARQRQPRQAPGCPEFGDVAVHTSVLDFGHEDDWVRPGQHAPRQGSHEVVWWDPGKLRLKVDRTRGLLRDDLLSPGPSTGLETYRQWREQRRQTIEKAQRKSLDVFAATEAVTAPPAEISVELIPRHALRPSGRRFGTLVHAILRDVHLGATRSGVEAIARSQGRFFGATEAEVEAAIEAVESALQHPLLARARSAARVHREAPVTFRCEDGRILEGTIDLAFLEGGSWTVLDFKTDADVLSKRQQYERQLAWYVTALSRIMNQPARGVLLGV
jgi:ATP-dependent exoDNAse (exonuclease V) beta subunit